MDFFGDYGVNSEVISPEIQTLTETKSVTTTPTTSQTIGQKILIPLNEREKEILIFSLFGIIIIMGILLIACLCKKKRNGIDFEMERLTAGSSTTLFDKNR